MTGLSPVGGAPIGGKLPENVFGGADCALTPTGQILTGLIGIGGFAIGQPPAPGQAAASNLRIAGGNASVFMRILQGAFAGVSCGGEGQSLAPFLGQAAAARHLDGYSLFFAVQAALMAALESDEQLASIFDDGTYPRAVFGDTSIRPFDTQQTAATIHAVPVHVYSRHAGMNEARDIAARIEEALGADIEISGQSILVTGVARTGDRDHGDMRETILTVQLVAEPIH